jgi:hypothetical protein
MRSEYGKLVYLLMDSVLPEIENMLEFSCKKKVVTVYDLLSKKGASALFDDPAVMIATQV